MSENQDNLEITDLNNVDNDFLFNVSDFLEAPYNDGNDDSFLQIIDSLGSEFSATQKTRIPGSAPGDILIANNDLNSLSFDMPEFPEFPSNEQSNTGFDGFFNLPAFDDSMLAMEPETDHTTSRQRPTTDDDTYDSGSMSMDEYSSAITNSKNTSNYQLVNSTDNNLDQKLGTDTKDVDPLVSYQCAKLRLAINPLNQGFSEPAGLKEVEELARACMEQIEPNARGWNAPIFFTHLMDWGIPQESERPPNPMCQSCQLMRRIIHSNGMQESRLEIHGLGGQPHHAVSECRPCVDDGRDSSLNREMIEFPSRNPEHVKQFVAEYNHVRRKEGCILRHDTFLTNAVIARGTDKPKFGWPGWSANQSLTQYNGIKNPCNQKESSASNYLPKSNYSAQRQRTGKIQMSELASFFHLPITEAAKQLRICPTVIKKICRRNGLRRWPHRKIKSIERLIQSLELTLVSATGEVNDSVRNQIASLRNEQARLYGGYVG